MLSVVFIAITHSLLYLATLSVLTCCACLYFCALFHYLLSFYRIAVLLSPQLAMLSLLYRIPREIIRVISTMLV